MNYKPIHTALRATSVLPASSNTSFTSLLTDYSGNSQTNFPAQPAFLAGSGLDVSFI